MNQSNIINLKTGDVLLLPPNWLHEVDTVEDSIVFGTNFITEASLMESIKEFRDERTRRAPKSSCYQNMWTLAIMYFHEKQRKMEAEMIQAGKVMDTLLKDQRLSESNDMKATLRKLKTEVS